MSTSYGRPWGSELRHELNVLRGNWFWFVLLGIALIVLGFVALGSVVVATLATALVIGALLLVGGVGELIGGILGGTSIVAAIGALVIALQPPGAKDLMAQLFGTNDKAVLEIAVATGGLIVGGVLGLAARRDERIAMAGFATFGLIAFVLLVADPLTTLQGSLIVAFVATAVAIMTLSWLTGAMRRFAESVTTSTDAARRGFIALAALIFGRWTPVGAFLGALLFQASVGLQRSINVAPPPGQLGDILNAIPGQFYDALPYLITIIVLAGVVGRSIPPAADGKPYQREGKAA